MIGGAVDPFFSDDVLRETPAAIPDAQLRIFPRSGHGVPKQQARAVQETVAEFLTSGRAPAP